MMEFITQPWAWYIAGPLIALTMFLLLYFGENFGVSGNLRTMCAIGGAGKVNDFFKFNWRSQIWNLVFVVGGIVGGFVSNQYLMPEKGLDLNPKTVEKLEALGFSDVGATFLPDEIFGLTGISIKGVLILILGGFFVGFGARYAGGCTSGHAISGLSNLQIPSLIAVVGFFIGGLLMTHIFIPYLF